MDHIRKTDYLNSKTDVGKFWEQYWSEQNIEDQIKELNDDKVAPIIKKWIETAKTDENVIILDGGCGNCRFVMYLHEPGLETIGIDFNERATKLAKNIDPDLKVVQGNVLSLPFRSNSVDHYISLGVLEHIIEGPEKGVKEAYRIMKRNGFFFFSVPYMNNIRVYQYYVNQLKKKIFSGSKNPDEKFYQYYFTKKELKSILHASGFEVLKEYPLNHELGLIRSMLIVRRNRLSNFLTIVLARAIALIHPWFSPHTALLISRKL